MCLVRGGVPEPAAGPRRRRLPDPVTRRSTSSRSARAAGRSRGSTPVARSWSGPESAGAVPGPACYGLGGTEPTVTDADLVLGRIPAGTAFPGLGRLDVDAAAARDRRRRAHRRGDRAGGRRQHGAGGAGGDRRAGRRRRASSRWSRSAARARCTRARSPTRSGCARCWCRRVPGCCPRSGSCRRRRSGSWCGRGPTRPTTPGSPRRAPRWRGEVAGLEGLAGAAVDGRDVPRLPLRGQSHELTVGDDRRTSRPSTPRRNGYARAGHPDRGRRAARPRPRRGAARPVRAAARGRGRARRRARGRGRARLHGLGPRRLGRRDARTPRAEPGC